jgi:GDP-fucose transporter C1
MLLSENGKIALVVLCYFIVSIALVFSNKVLLSSEGATIPAPFFITWFQCVLTALIIKLLGKSSEGAPRDSWLNEFPQVSYKLNVAKQVLPLSLMFVLMITFNNLCLKYVEVSFYNVARSLTIVVNVLFTYFLLGEKTSFNTLVCLLVVIIGFFVGSEGEINFSLIGTIFGVTSSCFVSLNAIYTKKVMPLVENDKWKLQYYNNMNASILFLLPMIAFNEHKIILAYAQLLHSAYFWFIMNIAGVLGFLIGIVTVMQINLTSPLTHNISGTAKSCVQTILALFIWKNPTTTSGLAGIFLVIFGSALYTYVRHKENEAARANKPLPLPVYQPVSTADKGPLDTDNESEIELVNEKSANQRVK